MSKSASMSTDTIQVKGKKQKSQILQAMVEALYRFNPKALLGSPKEQMASYFVAFYTNQTINWGMAAALSAILFVATLLLYMVYTRLVGSSAPAVR